MRPAYSLRHALSTRRESTPKGLVLVVTTPEEIRILLHLARHSEAYDMTKTAPGLTEKSDRVPAAPDIPPKYQFVIPWGTS